ncbi:MAG: RagB/SusD family nutrient uptake outer membrane protein [Prevotella sp.]|nr:RagB/SusD family nutrient uptake outer membrane protein [Prevotella sp.]
MNNIIYKIRTVGAASLALLILSCNSVLDEQPRSIYDPSFFSTETGITGGLTSLYAHLRDTYGQGYYYNNCETGTDEYTYAQSADGNFKDADFSGVGTLTPSSSRADVLWGSAFTYINTASGVIENATNAGLGESLVSEARFFRAFDYFRLVQTFGGVPLDLGAGDLKFNSAPTRTSVRNTVPEVYTKAIFPDLQTAVSNLPDNPRIIGGVTKNVARLVLAQAYLTYAWWLENPNDIPTYPTCDRKDPNGKDSKYYFQQAYDLATEGINNPGPYELQDTYYDVNLAQNDRNSECMLWADHTENSEYYNGGSLTYGSGSAPDNFVSWMVAWNYPNMQAKTLDGQAFNPVRRECVQALGRPWTRMAPMQEVFTKTFADKTNDSRFDGTFTCVFRANWNKDTQYSGATAYNANGLTIAPGDAVLSFIDSDAGITYPSGAGDDAVGGGTIPGRSDYVVGPSGISRFMYPMLWKLGPYRTDNGSGLGQPNAGSTRPYVILKFSEFYFVAAEAAVKLDDNANARKMINVIRARAGKWRFSNADNAVMIADHSAEMTAATPQTITIDYILDELSREYYGEGHRWFDLVRTQTWASRAGSYTIAGSATGDHKPVTYQRTITKENYLRPIPQSQIDALEMSDADLSAYQNPGYN